jgi:predicted nucleotidyltransferase
MTASSPRTNPALAAVAHSQPYPLLFVTISGAHLYGFPSPDSDYDLRGVHVLPIEEVVALFPGQETIEVAGDRCELEIDLVSHDVKKFFTLLLKKNGYVLEQLCSPLIVQSSPEHEELKSLVPACVTRHHAHHYLGFAQTQWKLFEKETPPRVKPLLYVNRVLLTGIHLMRTGQVEANLVKLNETYGLPYVPELIHRKLHGGEQGTLNAVDVEFHRCEYHRLRARLEEEHRSSPLPESATAGASLNDLLVRIRTRGIRPT